MGNLTLADLQRNSITHWDYRVVERDGDFGVYEVYYNNVPVMCEEEPIRLVAENAVVELKEMLIQIKDAFK